MINQYKILNYSMDRVAPEMRGYVHPAFHAYKLDNIREDSLMPRYQPAELSNQRFGKLVAIQRVQNDKWGHAQWYCNCDCGGNKIVKPGDLLKGTVASCGCLLEEMIGIRHPAYKHGLSLNYSMNPIYKVFKNIEKRLYNPNDKDYKNYGGRGISMCKEWKNNVMSFVKWSDENGYQDGYVIHRIDNDGDYTPDNCVWLGKDEHNKHHSSLRKRNVRGEYV